jgi:hypothetical protein
MNTIVKDLIQLKNHVSIKGAFDFQLIKPQIAEARDRFIVPFIGKEQYSYFADLTTIPTDVLSVYEAIEKAESNFAVYLSVPRMAVELTNSGFSTLNNKESNNSNWPERKDFERSLLKTAFFSLDKAIALLSENPTLFTFFNNSSFIKNTDGLIVKSLGEFQQFFNLNNSPQTFYHLVPTMRNIEMNYIDKWLNPTCKAQVLANADIKKMLEAVVVAYTIAQSVGQSSFKTENGGMVFRFEQLPWETSIKLDLNAIENIKNTQTEVAENALSIAKQKVMTDFPCASNDFLMRENLKLKSGLYL